MSDLTATLDQQVIKRAAAINWLVLDVDGFLTDGGLIYGDDGQEYKRFHARDGLGLGMWRRAGFNLAWITARKSGVVQHRADELGIEELHQGVSDKRQVLNELCERNEIDSSVVAFMGDDLVDYRAMQMAGLALTVADAHREIAAFADWQSSFPGGNGAVREACDMLLASKGLLEQATGFFTNEPT